MTMLVWRHTFVRTRGAPRVAWALGGLLAAVTVFGPSPAAAQQDRRPDDAVLKIMSFKAQFLWDGKVLEEGTSEVVLPWKHSEAEAEAHMDDVARVSIQNDPDVIILVEVENRAALTTLNDRLLTGRGYEAYITQGQDTYTGQDVGLLTCVDFGDGATAVPNDNLNTACAE
jgi:hypothetical protein